MGAGRTCGWLALLPLSALFGAGCPDLGDRPVDWSQFDRPAPPDAARPVDAGGVDEGGAADADVPPPEHAEVLLQHIEIAPKHVTIAAGGTVTWHNLDPTQHDVRSGTPDALTPLFNSGLLAPGGAFTFQFESPGLVEYYCATHSGDMNGAIVEVVGDAP